MPHAALFFWLAAALCLPVWAAGPAPDPDPLVYTLRAEVNLRQEPTTTSAVLMTLAQNESLAELERSGQWVRVRTLPGVTGWVHGSLVSDTWIRVFKAERILELMRGNDVAAAWPVALSPVNPLGDKVRQGDGATPEGRYFVCRTLVHPGQAKYGARSLRLSYPNLSDARDGLAAGIIDYAEYRAILRAQAEGRMPPQDTDLGGSIRIHGGGSGQDWTLGCIALSDEDVVELQSLVPDRVRVEVYKSRQASETLSNPMHLSRLVLAGAEAQLDEPSYYSLQATGYAGLDFPLGDIDSGQGVCADVAVRALRAAGLDLQALVHEDMIRRPGAYAWYAATPDFNIDHRRVRVLRVFLDRWARSLDAGETPLPGDIALFDTGIENGTVFDHVGVVGRWQGGGLPLVVNNWAPGLSTRAMDLLGPDFPEVVGVYRLGNALDYQ